MAVGIVLGLLVGPNSMILPEEGAFSGDVFGQRLIDWTDWIGQLFLRLIKMVVVPLVFASLVVGIASLDNVRQLGRLGGKTLIFYLCTTALAISWGVLLANVLQPDQSLPEATQQKLLDSFQADTQQRIQIVQEKPSITETLLQIIPTNPLQALVEGKMLQIIFCALCLGIALTMIPESVGQPVIHFFTGLNAAMIQIMHLIMWLAPVGVGALIAVIVADFGLEILGALLHYALVVIVGLALFMGVVHSFALKLFSKVKVGTFFRGIRPAQLVAFSSSSSSATLPLTMECAEKNLGVPQAVSSFTLPLGATINMDGTALYQGVSAIFIAQVYDLGLSLEQQFTVVLTATLASIGTAGTPGAAIVMLAMVLQSVGIPLEGIGLILGVERLLDMCRTVVNVTGDACCAVVVAHSEAKRDEQLNSPQSH
ncbi:MAG: dicarboxylate/amino acid:cation symporter, partial [Bacteroidales bacterium]|nr:dicarboxylate/amino acid:cation symporter [Bacteroidales bacterium]